MPSIAIDGVTLSFPILLIALGAVVTAVVVARGGRSRRTALWGGLLLSLALIGLLTLASLVGDDFDGAQGVNLVPFQEIQRGLDSRGSTPWFNLVGNVLLFIPFGAAVASLARSGFIGRVVYGTLLGGLLSTAIEPHPVLGRPRRGHRRHHPQHRGSAARRTLRRHGRGPCRLAPPRHPHRAARHAGVA
ncbi:VanZ family protein [Demequina litorisediminis]|uniref:VanZ-like domain-containing protein n=1 Tax=Demequina litorisediminis TaxID=1849022 RepID=A0ABQ6IDQ6_9MICO|nr:VanZ family protein [Demequina litorisediminis]GMA35297.1 hypothetical protein GCM10025876_15010 [Demequina litorisediminis]